MRIAENARGLKAGEEDVPHAQSAEDIKFNCSLRRGAEDLILRARTHAAAATAVTSSAGTPARNTAADWVAHFVSEPSARGADTSRREKSRWGEPEHM